MSATIAFLFLVQVAATCGPAEPSRLAAGASFAPAVLTFDQQRFDPSTLAPARLSQAPATTLGGAVPEAVAPNEDSGGMQCKPAPAPIA